MTVAVTGCLPAALRPRSSAWPQAPAPAPSLPQGHDAIDAWHIERLVRAVWPPNDDAIDFRRLAKAEMGAKVRLRAIASATDHIPTQPLRARLQGDDCANSVAWHARGTREGDRYPVAGLRHVSQQRGPLVMIVDDDVDPAV